MTSTAVSLEPLSRATLCTALRWRKLVNLSAELVNHLICETDFIIKGELLIGVEIQPGEVNGVLELLRRLFFLRDNLNGLRGFSLFDGFLFLRGVLLLSGGFIEICPR